MSCRVRSTRHAKPSGSFPAPPLPVMQTVCARAVTPRCHARCGASVTPTPPAERRSGQAADLLPGIQQNRRFTGRRTRLPVPRRRACGRTSTSSRCKIGIKHCRFLLRRRLRRTRNRTFVRTHAVPRYPGQLTQAAEQLPRLSPHRSAAADGGTSTLRSYCAGSAIGDATVIVDANAAPNP